MSSFLIVHLNQSSARYFCPFPRDTPGGQAIVSPWSQHHNASAVLSHIGQTSTRAEPLWFLVIFNLQSRSYGKQTCHHRPVQFDVKQRRKRLGSNVCVFIVEAFSTQCFRIPVWTASRGGSKRPQWTEQRLGPKVRQRKRRGRSFCVCK